MHFGHVFLSTDHDILFQNEFNTKPIFTLFTLLLMSYGDQSRQQAMIMTYMQFDLNALKEQVHFNKLPSASF